MVEVKGTLQELYELFGAGAKSPKIEKTTFNVGKPTMPKKKRAKSAWQRYMGQKKNQIKFKSGSKKGLLNMKAMARKFKKTGKKSTKTRKKRRY